MPDIIYRQAAIQIAEKYGLGKGSALGRHSGIADCIASEIENLPAYDALPVENDFMPVVYCKDCKHYGYDAYGYKTCNAPGGLVCPEDNSFCSFGIRINQFEDIRKKDVSAKGKGKNAR